MAKKNKLPELLKKLPEWEFIFEWENKNSFVLCTEWIKTPKGLNKIISEVCIDFSEDRKYFHSINFILDKRLINRGLDKFFANATVGMAAKKLEEEGLPEFAKTVEQIVKASVFGNKYPCNICVW